MKARILALGTALALGGALSGCGLLDAVMARAALAKAAFSLERVSVLRADLPFGQDPKADLQVVLGVSNPNNIRVQLDRLDYELFLEGTRVGTGATTSDFSVAPGAKSELPLTVSVPYAGLPQAVLSALVNRKAEVGFNGTSHIATPLMTLDYPVSLTRTLTLDDVL